MRPSLRRYLACSFWLLVPVLAFNLAYARELPAGFQPDVFWRDIPLVISGPESALRVLVLGLPVLMPIAPAGARGRRAGLALYALGLIAYLAAWTILIRWPTAAWSTSALGFTAPAWTPALWLAGLTLASDVRLAIPVRGYRRWMYGAAAALFLLVHVGHAALVFGRLP